MASLSADGPSVNYLPAEIQEQSNWNEETFIGDLIKAFQIQSDHVVVCCLILSNLAGGSCPQSGLLKSFPIWMKVWKSSMEYFNPNKQGKLCLMLDSLYICQQTVHTFHRDCEIKKEKPHRHPEVLLHQTVMEFLINDCWLEAWEVDGWRNGWVDKEEKMSWEVPVKVLEEKWWSVSITCVCVCVWKIAGCALSLGWLDLHASAQGCVRLCHLYYVWQRGTKVEFLLISHLAHNPWKVRGALQPLSLFNMCFRRGTRGHCKLPLHSSPLIMQISFIVWLWSVVEYIH